MTVDEIEVQIRALRNGQSLTLHGRTIKRVTFNMWTATEVEVEMPSGRVLPSYEDKVNPRIGALWLFHSPSQKDGASR